MQLDHVRALVTGGASGLGRHLVTRLAESGATVAFCDLGEDRVQQAAAEIGLGVRGFACDVSSEDDVVATVSAAADALGGLDLLVNNAGIFRDGLLIKPDKATGEVRRMTLSQWQQVIDVDLTGPFLCAREFAAQVVERQVPASLIVNISSVARHGNPGQSNYSAAKAGLVADTRLWAVELARYGTRVAAVAPGFVRTPILDAMRPEVLDGMVQRVPLRRVGEPEHIWQAVEFLIRCDYVTGTCVDVDGGIRL